MDTDYTDNLTDGLFSFFSPYESQEVLHRYLLRYYQRRGVNKKKASELSYTNTSVFHYEWVSGRTYWKEGLNASLYIKPLLLFYGLTHLLKGVVLLEDPAYPESTDVLAHGVTSRKRKKKEYTFLDDEVKIQKKGFFPHFSNTLFHVKHSAGEKWKMADLLLKWEEILPLYEKVKEKNAVPKVELGTLPSLSVHYLLLYNLGMISRYEAEWWGELITQQHSEDYPFIKTYLTHAGHHIPSLFHPFFNKI